MSTEYFCKVASVIVVYTKMTENQLSKFEHVILHEQSRVVLLNSWHNFLALINLFGEKFYFSKSVETSYNFPLAGLEWECPNSPFGTCVYDHQQDRGHDNCLICGEPEERK
jgi:hypothetical protein